MDMAIANVSDFRFKTISSNLFFNTQGRGGWGGGLTLCHSDPLLPVTRPDWWLEAALCRLYPVGLCPLAPVGLGNIEWEIEREIRIHIYFY